VGKNFIHDHFMQLNSALFVWNDEHTVTREIKFASFGFATGRAKGTSSTDRRGWYGQKQLFEPLMGKKFVESSAKDRWEARNVYKVAVWARKRGDTKLEYWENQMMHDDPFIGRIASLPDVLWEQLRGFEGLESSRARFAKVCFSHLTVTRRMLSWFPWDRLFKACLDQDYELFRGCRAVFRSIVPSHDKVEGLQGTSWVEKLQTKLSERDEIEEGLLKSMGFVQRWRKILASDDLIRLHMSLPQSVESDWELETIVYDRSPAIRMTKAGHGLDETMELP